MCHEQSKLKDNELSWMSIHGQQMLALTEEVAQKSKTTNALEEKLNEIEELHNARMVTREGRIRRRVEATELSIE